MTIRVVLYSFIKPVTEQAASVLVDAVVRYPFFAPTFISQTGDPSTKRRWSSSTAANLFLKRGRFTMFSEDRESQTDVDVTELDGFGYDCIISAGLNTSVEDRIVRDSASFLTEVFRLFDEIRGEYGVVHDNNDALFGVGLLHEGLRNVYWANLFGPRILDRLGRAWMDLAPFEDRIEGADDRHMFVLSRRPPRELGKPADARAEQVKDAIGRKAFATGTKGAFW